MVEICDLSLLFGFKNAVWKTVLTRLEFLGINGNFEVYPWILKGTWTTAPFSHTLFKIVIETQFFHGFLRPIAHFKAQAEILQTPQNRFLKNHKNYYLRLPWDMPFMVILKNSSKFNFLGIFAPDSALWSLERDLPCKKKFPQKSAKFGFYDQNYIIRHFNTFFKGFRN